MKLLISWMSKAGDFVNGDVNEDGPNFTFHQYYYEHDMHLLLCSEREDDTAFEFLLNQMRRSYPNRQITGRYLGIQDVIDLEEILSKVQPILLEYKDEQIDIFFSPGTSIMQLCWFILHSTLGLNTQLFQLREARLSKDNLPEKLILEVQKSITPLSASLKHIRQDKPEGELHITESLKPVFERAYKVAKARDVAILISGETGTGKEVIARYIHDNSARRNAPFIPINCSAFSDGLLESRLFGYRKGAFTDAKADTQGLFQMANTGTIFLDEIGDISPYMQQALLRVLQEKEVHPIGGSVQKVDLRVIAATNKDLVSLCEEGKYRWDLYYRLAVAEVEIPPLRERGIDEISEMIDYFIKKKQRDMHSPGILRFEKEAWDKLLHYAFPGNVREMENIIESLYVFAEEEITLNDLPKRIQINSGKSYVLSEVEREHILKVTKLFGNQKKKTALALGISYNTYKKKIESFQKIANSANS